MGFDKYYEYDDYLTEDEYYRMKYVDEYFDEKNKKIFNFHHIINCMLHVEKSSSYEKDVLSTEGVSKRVLNSKNPNEKMEKYHKYCYQFNWHNVVDIIWYFFDLIFLSWFRVIHLAISIPFDRFLGKACLPTLLVALTFYWHPNKRYYYSGDFFNKAYDFTGNLIEYFLIILIVTGVFLLIDSIPYRWKDLSLYSALFELQEKIDFPAEIMKPVPMDKKDFVFSKNPPKFMSEINILEANVDRHIKADKKAKLQADIDREKELGITNEPTPEERKAAQEFWKAYKEQERLEDEKRQKEHEEWLNSLPPHEKEKELWIEGYLKEPIYLDDDVPGAKQDAENFLRRFLEAEDKGEKVAHYSEREKNVEYGFLMWRRSYEYAKNHQNEEPAK